MSIKLKKFRSFATIMAIALVMAFTPILGQATVHAAGLPYKFDYVRRMEWTKGSGTGYKVYIVSTDNVTFPGDHLTSVDLGDTRLRPGVDYTASGSSTLVINISASFLSNMAVGKYGIRPHFDNGHMAASFYVVEPKQEAPKTEPSKAATPISAAPRTETGNNATPKPQTGNNVASTPSTPSTPNTSKAKTETGKTKPETTAEKPSEAASVEENAEAVAGFETAPLIPGLRYNLPEATVEVNQGPNALVITIIILLVCAIITTIVVTIIYKRRKQEEIS